MPRLVSNPPNPWATRHVEWLEAPPPVQVEVYEECAKSILARNDSPDVPFRFSLNPYRGCQHACAYCYARPTHQYLGFGAGTDFDSKIVVKTNAAELLRRALAKRSWRREWIAFSGVTDCYQPLEASYGITRACLEVCREFRNPVGIITKSALVRRDVDVLLALDRVADVQVILSIPFADDAT
ncbi:MAG: radical SAM protein, partial [Planctomycetota bacterium]